MTNQFLSEVCHLLEIGIGPIRFEHRKFGIVFSGNAFVSKVTVDFEYLVEPAHEQTFQIKFERDAKIKIEAERLVMRGEWFSCRASGDRLQDWRLDFQKAALLQETPRLTQDCDAFFKNRAGAFVRKKIEITLPVPRFNIL